MGIRSRHWKQRFDPEETFVCRKHMKYGDLSYKPGDIFDTEEVGVYKLKMLWNSGFIELANWKPPKYHNPHEIFEELVSEAELEAIITTQSLKDED